MDKRPGLKDAAVQRFNRLMADGQKHSEAKAKAKAREHREPLFAYTDGKIHAFETGNSYQTIITRFIDWCCDKHDVRVTCKRSNSQRLGQPLMRRHPQSLQWHWLLLYGIICSMYAFLCCFLALYATLNPYSSVYIHGQSRNSNDFSFATKNGVIKRAVTTV